MEVLNDIPLELSFDDVISYLGIGEDFIEELKPLFDKFIAVARPKAIIGCSEVSEKTDGSVSIDNVQIASRILSVNLDKIVYPYIITSGREGYEMARSVGDPLCEYWLDGMCEFVLARASQYVKGYIKNKFNTGEIYSLAPGSLADWPLRGQRQLFSLLGGAEAVMREIGLELTESCLMLPIKSVSGLYFEASEHFVQCSLCPRECPNRREVYNHDLFTEKYGLTDSSFKI